MYRISTNTGLFCAIGSNQKAVDILKENGFQCFDLTLSWLVDECDMFFSSEDYLAKAKQFKQYIDSIGMTCNQVHSFMAVSSKSYSKQRNKWGLMITKRCIEIAGIVGSPYVVIHPFSEYSIDENFKLFKELLEVAHTANVKIAIENMPTGFFSDHLSIKNFIDSLDDEYACVCLDIGHAEIRKEPQSSAVQIIDTLKDKIQCLHIHDNNHVDDEHLFPGNGKIDFYSILEALKRNNYSGDITFECDGELWPISIPERIKKLSTIIEIGNQFKKHLES